MTAIEPDTNDTCQLFVAFDEREFSASLDLFTELRNYRWNGASVEFGILYRN